jgi:hypothetical protein
MEATALGLPRTANKSQVLTLRKHLTAAARILQDSSYSAISYGHRRKLRKLASLVESVTPSLCIVVERVEQAKPEVHA